MMFWFGNSIAEMDVVYFYDKDTITFGGVKTIRDIKGMNSAMDSICAVRIEPIDLMKGNRIPSIQLFLGCLAGRLSRARWAGEALS